MLLIWIIFVCNAVVLNEAAACYNNYGRQSIFYKVQTSLQGTMLLIVTCQIFLLIGWIVGSFHCFHILNLITLFAVNSIILVVVRKNGICKDKKLCCSCFKLLQPNMEGGRNCYSDEHYLPTFFSVSAPIFARLNGNVICFCPLLLSHLVYVQMVDPGGIANWSVTYVDWSEGKWHPRAFAARDITYHLMKYLTVRDLNFTISLFSCTVFQLKRCFYILHVESSKETFSFLILPSMTLLLGSLKFFCHKLNPSLLAFFISIFFFKKNTFILNTNNLCTEIISQ